ncbi:unnamed protein product [Arabidopsis halleri]
MSFSHDLLFVKFYCDRVELQPFGLMNLGNSALGHLYHTLVGDYTLKHVERRLGDLFFSSFTICGVSAVILLVI